MIMRCKLPPESDLAIVYKLTVNRNFFTVSSTSAFTVFQSIEKPPCSAYRQVWVNAIFSRTVMKGTDAIVSGFSGIKLTPFLRMV